MRGRIMCISSFRCERSFLCGGIDVRYYPRLTAIDELEAVRYAGAPDKSAYSQQVVAAICREVLLMLEPAACWEEYDYQEAQRLVMAAPPYALPSCDVGRHLLGSGRVAVLAVTVGAAVEEFSRRLFAEGRYSEALLAEGAASAAVEQAADQLCTQLDQRYRKQGLALTSRYSPGYGDWALSEQPLALLLARGETIGITLTRSLMLMPKKSITAIVGWRQAPANTPLSGCASCPKLDCTMRKG